MKITNILYQAKNKPHTNSEDYSDDDTERRYWTVQGCETATDLIRNDMKATERAGRSFLP